MVAMSMCVHDVASAAIADAMSVIYETSEMDPASPLAIRLINTLYMETVIALEEMRDELFGEEGIDTEGN